MRAKDILLAAAATAGAIGAALAITAGLHSAEPTAEERKARAESAINGDTRVVVLDVGGEKLPCVVWLGSHMGGISCDWSRWGQTPTTPAPAN